MLRDAVINVGTADRGGGAGGALGLLLVVAVVVFLTGGGFGYRRGGRI